jgi:hypothetical protein
MCCGLEMDKNMKAKEFQEKLEGYAAQYLDWKKPIIEFHEKFREEHNIDYFDREGSKKLEQAVQEFTAKYQAQNPDPTEIINSFLDQEYKVYLNATQEECDAIRASFSVNREFEDLLLGYVYNAAKELRSTRDVKWLERGLVAASLENCGMDYRDTYLSLNDIYKGAADVGIDPNPYFQKAASLASREKPRGGSTPLSVLLDGYTKRPEKPLKAEVREIKTDPLSVLIRFIKGEDI